MAMRTLLIMALLLSLTACASSRLINAFIPDEGYVVHNNLGYGELPRQALDVYVPEPKPAKAPVVVFFYGGRWSGGTRDFYRFVGQALVSRGYVAVIADYRIYPEVKFPAFVEDGARAVRWARAHAGEFGGDPGKLFVMGHSSGAHIAAMLALDPQYLQAVGGRRDWLAGMIGLSGPYDFLPLTDEDLKDMFGPPAHYPQSQPINFVDGRNPPLLLLHGRTDTTVKLRNTVNLTEKIQQQGGQVETVIYPVMGHVRMVASLAAPLRFTSDVLEDVIRFIGGQANRPGTP
jgi:acetyl esterase/lipase